MLNAGPVSVAVVVPTTTSRRDLPLHVEIEPGESGLDETSYARCEDVRSVSVERMVHRLGTAPPEVVHEMNRALRYILEL